MKARILVYLAVSKNHPLKGIPKQGLKYSQRINWQLVKNCLSVRIAYLTIT